MWRIITLCTVITGLAANNIKTTYENYKVFRILPRTFTQVKVLQDMRNEFSYWQEPTGICKEVHIMVSPHKLAHFYEILDKLKVLYRLQIHNVQALIDNTMSQYQSQSFDFNSYHPLEKIYDNLEELAKKYPNKVEVVVGGRTYEGREIKGVKITNNKKKSGIFIEGGIHAREWISPATVMYILHQLLTNKDSNVRYVADNHNWFIFPIFNPDGYVYSFTKDRLWTKNRKPSNSFCFGSNLNRNWDFRWNTTGVSNNPCSEVYPGNKAFSEIETKSMSEYMSSNHFYAYISFHSYKQQLLFPCGYMGLNITHYDRSYRTGLVAIKALKKKFNTRYDTGCIGKFQNLSSGLSIDYVANVLRTPVVYLYKLRDKSEYGFLLPPNQIIPTGKETFDSLIAIMNRIMCSETHYSATLF